MTRVTASPPIARPRVERHATGAEAESPHPVKIATERVSLFYGGKQALHDVTLDIGSNQVTALIGPVTTRSGRVSPLTSPDSIVFT